MPWLPLIGTVVGVDLPDTPEVAALGAEFRATVRHVQLANLLARALPGPMVLLVEDAHRLDDATAELLGHITSHVADRPWLVCVSRRPGDEGWVPDPTTEPVVLELEPLSDAESGRLLLRVAEQRPLVPSARAVLAGRAAGNPLFLRELLQAVADGSDGTDLALLPDTLEEVVGATIDQLARVDRELLRVAAVLGAKFDVDVLAEVIGQPVPAVEARLARIDRFVAPDPAGAMRFQHVMVRDVAYEGLPFRRRRVLHGQVGDVLAPRAQAQESLVDLLALHYRAGRPARRRLAQLSEPPASGHVATPRRSRLPGSCAGRSTPQCTCPTSRPPTEPRSASTWATRSSSTVATTTRPRRSLRLAARCSRTTSGSPGC